MYKEKIINAETGEETWRDYTDAEIAEVEALLTKAKAEAAAKAKAQAQAEAQRSIALAKLEALGLTIDDLQALGL